MHYPEYRNRSIVAFVEEIKPDCKNIDGEFVFCYTYILSVTFLDSPSKYALDTFFLYRDRAGTWITEFDNNPYCDRLREHISNSEGFNYFDFLRAYGNTF